MTNEISIIAVLSAFGAGIASFISPCVLPLIPGYISFISGVSLKDLKETERNKFVKTVVINSLLFVAGFSIIFIALGATASAIGQFLLKHQRIFYYIAGILIIILGIHLTGLFRIKFLDYEKRVQLQNKPIGLVGSLLVGMAFAFGWTPCVGPFLAGVLALAASQDTILAGVILLAVYSLGLGLPFIITGLAINAFFSFFNKIKKHYKTIEIISGVLLIIVGILIFTNNLAILSAKMSEWFPY